MFDARRMAQCLRAIFYLRWPSGNGAYRLLCLVNEYPRRMSGIPHQLYELGGLIYSASNLRTQIGRRKIHINDSLTVLCASFLEREIEYAKSVKRLVEVGEVASAAIIARTMHEGAACLHWVVKSEDPKARAVKWREFVYNESLKVLDEHEQENPGATNIYDIKREAQRLKERGRRFKGPRWTVDEQDRTWWARDLIENLVETQPHMKEGMVAYYQGLSAFVHWSPGAFSIDNEKWLAEEWASTEFPDGFIGAALATAHASLFVVATLVAGHFDISQS